MLKVDYAELHHALFLGGKNHQLKLFAKAGLQMVYDRTEKELIVSYNGKTAFIPSTNVASYEIAPDVAPKEEPKPMVRLGRPPKAQASTPHDHVFADGPGKTRD